MVVVFGIGPAGGADGGAQVPARNEAAPESAPGQGQQGLYFYYNIISRALSASGVEEVRDTIRWREAIVRKVLALQNADGSWVNANNRWWENDPVLATSYALLALEFASGLTR